MATRRQITRYSTTKNTPDLTDTLEGEQSYSFSGDTLYIRNPLTNTQDAVGGKAFTDSVRALEIAIQALSEGSNRVPVAPTATANAPDTSLPVTGNVLTGAADADGDPMTVSSISYKTVSRTLGSTFATDYGSMLMATNGSWTFTIGAAGRALANGIPATETFTFRAADDRGGIGTATTLTVHLMGTDHGPLAMTTTGLVQAGVPFAFNILSNDSDPEGAALTVLEFTVGGQTYQPGQTAIIGAGSIVVAANGVGTYTPAANYSGLVPTVSCLITDGTSTPVPSLLTLSVMAPEPTRSEVINWFRQYRNGTIAPDSARIAPNPAPARATPSWVNPDMPYPIWNFKLDLPSRAAVDSTSLDYRVGPGMEYATPGDVPWLTLLPGDRVFIYWRSTPYNNVIPLMTRGEALRWIEVIGVRGPAGQLPVLDGVGAVEPLGTPLNTTIQRNGLVIVHPPLDGRGGMSYKPGYIHIHGLELRNAKSSNQMTNYLGNSGAWGNFAAGIYGLGFDHLTITGCKITQNMNGMFAICNDNGERFYSRYLHVLFNHFEDNSISGSSHVHNSYTEVVNVIYEYNFFGGLATGSLGDLLKERSTGQIFRYNKFDMDVGLNCISLRDPEATYQIGYSAVDQLGQSLANNAFIYSNEFIVRTHIMEAVVAHGDGYTAVHGEVRGGGSVYFWRNRVIVKHAGASGYTGGIEYVPIPAKLFASMNTRAATSFKAWNNLLYSERTQAGPALELAVFYWGSSGTPNFRSNFAHNLRPVWLVPESTTLPLIAVGARYGGTLADLGIVNTNDDPGFVSWTNDQFSLLPSSPFYALNATDDPFVVDRGLTVQGDPIVYPFHDEPVPSALTPPTITGNTIRGNTLTASGFVLSPLPDSVLYRWYREDDAIAGATASTYLTVVADEGKALTVDVRGTNATGTGPASLSAAVAITSASAPINTAAPVISGSGQATFAHTVSTGNWANDPASYSYQVYLDGVAVSGQTTNSYTPSVGDVGKALSWRVNATNAGGETSFAVSNSITIAAVSYDPDGTGRWNFAGPDATTLAGLSGAWNGFTGIESYGRGDTHMTCQGGVLRPTASWTLWNIARAWLVGTQGDDCAVEARMQFSAADKGARIGLRQTATQFYEIGLGVDGIRVRRNGTAVSSKLGMTLTSPATLKVVPAGGVLSIYVNGVLEHTYTDATPLTGGYPGVISDRLGAAQIDCGWEWWTDTPI